MWHVYCNDMQVYILEICVSPSSHKLSIGEKKCLCYDTTYSCLFHNLLNQKKQNGFLKRWGRIWVWFFFKSIYALNYDFRFKKVKNHESSIRNLIETFLLQRLTKEKCELCDSFVIYIMKLKCSTVDSGSAGGARAPPEFGGSEKGQSLISAYRSFAITMNTPGFKKLSTVL